MIRIGLTQRVEHLVDRGERRDCLDQAWTPLLDACGLLAVPLPNRLPDVAATVSELGLGGLILTGGNDLAHLPDAVQPAPERDELERRLLALARERDLPVLGVCRGLQMMIAESGGELCAIEGHVARPHRLKIRPQSGLPLDSGRRVNSFHGFGFRENALGDGWRAAALAPDGTVEAIVHRRYPQWGIMWHPEREPRDEGDARLLRRLFGDRR